MTWYDDPHETAPRWRVIRKMQEIKDVQAANFHLGRMLLLLAPAMIALVGVGGLAWYHIGRKDLMARSPLVPVDRLFSLSTNKLQFSTASTNGIHTPMYLRVPGWAVAESSCTVYETNKAGIKAFTETTYRFTSSREQLFPQQDALDDATTSSHSYGVTNRGGTNIQVTSTNQYLTTNSFKLTHTDVVTAAKVSVPTVRFTQRRVINDYERPFETLPREGDAPKNLILTLSNHPERLAITKTNTVFVRPLEIFSAE